MNYNEIKSALNKIAYDYIVKNGVDNGFECSIYPKEEIIKLNYAGEAVDTDVTELYALTDTEYIQSDDDLVVRVVSNSDAYPDGFDNCLLTHFSNEEMMKIMELADIPFEFGTDFVRGIEEQ